ncbi:VWA-like domain-containing protein [Eubacterium oxidoreducens]|uniref:Predicted metal-dependent peptidase n=1 Tax=Eubacterium oxidoreducens TaxID=1732 RepID=A0A1G6CGS0_EUBOX|nr:VWA-like domain-containing protein [Eubacterium oxidoreducens]SDB32114.1 Predicted metal-dependent peptidase [Eubacterium oxidoreducens]
MEQDIRQSAQVLARKVMIYARDNIMVSMRFLDRALFKMPFVESETVEAFGVTGEHVLYNTVRVLELFKTEKNYPTRAFLHMIFHCIFSHPFHYEKMYRESWDLACDLAVEYAVMDMNIPGCELKTDAAKKRILEGLKEEVPMLTAEHLYRYFNREPERFAYYLEKQALFEMDDHIVWMPKKETNAEDRNDHYNIDTATGQVGCHEADQGEDGEQEPVDEALVGQRGDGWEEISEHAKTDLQMFSKDQGFGSSGLLMNLQEAVRDKIDYTEFLKKFAVLGEEMHINDDEFDYIYYTYGMELYENMPLIEPLEYRENKRIREFVIAIDTSGSCQGETIHRFLRKTYSILKSSESYFERVNIHIIQCDAKVQHDEKVTTDEEFEAYMKDVELVGFGGTDFRPVFEYVDGLIRRHEFQNLKGLIYFTDGNGTFPEKQPEYETAFVFIEEGYTIPKTPDWAIRLVLQEDEIE